VSEPDAKLYRLETTRYDRVAGMLLALLTLLGVLVSVMLVVWLTSRIFATQAAVPVTLEEVGSEEDAWGPGNDIEPPPSGESDLADEETEEVLNAVADAVATRLAALENPVMGATDRGGIGQGGGNGRGGGGTGHGRKGRPQRWEVMFDRGLTLESYATQLDFFGIELAVLMPDKRVEYASHLVRSRPDRRSGPADADKRYYLAWKRGELQQADRELLNRAGIQVGTNIILKFLPPETEQKMAALEQATAGKREARSTLFGIRRGTTAPYEFYVIRQTYR
jgi:hypothetical protein